jgi:hypothetical protein
MLSKFKIPEWLKRTTSFFSKADCDYQMEAIKVSSGISSTMVADRKRANRPVVDKRAALYQAVKNSSIKIEGQR